MFLSCFLPISVLNKIIFISVRDHLFFVIFSKVAIYDLNQMGFGRISTGTCTVENIIEFSLLFQYFKAHAPSPPNVAEKRGGWTSSAGKITRFI
jgi:hypothetical protein